MLGHTTRTNLLCAIAFELIW